MQFPYILESFLVPESCQGPSTSSMNLVPEPKIYQDRDCLIQRQTVPKIETDINFQPRS
jgi:hypothetical protein